MFSSLVTATKNRYASLRAGDEADGDTEDDSHISRVLRNYYAEQSRPFPPWLGGGPQQQQQQQQQQQARPGQPAQGVSLRRGQNPGSGPQPGVKTTLSDIWDTPQQQPAGQQQAAGAAPGQNAAGMNKMRFFRRDQNPAPPQQHQQQQHYQGGHQSQGSYDDAHAPNPTAQSSIRDRLWSNRGGGANAGRTPSPQLSQPSTPTPPPQQYQAYNGGGSYGSRDKSPARPHGRGNDKPVMSATISFGQDDYEFGGYGGGYAGAGSGGSHGSHGGSGGSGGSGYRKGPPLGGGKVGLPSGPRMHR